jgi:hypothetical protein
VRLKFPRSTSEIIFYARNYLLHTEDIIHSMNLISYFLIRLLLPAFVYQMHFCVLTQH